MLRVTILTLLAASADACTTLIVGKKASVDGSVMCTHSDDGEANPDSRLVKVPASDHAKGSTRPIYYDTEDYPRFVGDRGVDAYLPKNNPGATPSVAIGSIPQVAHTFAYYEGTYGILNEHQVGIGESTCSAIYGAKARGHGGDALFSIDTLSRIAMERATTAREAVQLMGSLAEAEGFYGAGEFEGTGESLMVTDPNEGYIFHILPDHTGKSAVWAAQRVGDDEVGVVANMFVIRRLLTNQTTDGRPDFLFSASVHSAAQKNGWWSPSDGPLDFVRVYSDGEYAHKFYSGRRVWGAYRLLVPGTPLAANYTDLRTEPDVYPATLRATRKLSPLDLMATHRDMYQGTPFDMTTGVAAGPFGNPDRYSTASVTKLPGAWERSIGLYRTGYSHVVQSRGWLPNAVGGVLWFGPHAAHGTCYLPLHAGGAAVPAPYSRADPSAIDRASAYWGHKYALNVARLRYADMMAIVGALQTKFEQGFWARVKAQTAPNATSAVAPATEAEQLAAAADDDAQKVLAAWWALPDQLIFQFADGWHADGAALGYPDAWLKQIGWEEGPAPPPKDPNLPHCCQKGFTGGDGLVEKRVL
tara:strand:- start:162 stop:1919 length:1758 start_codon:yes stop_codon:yes gene_type:complete